MAEGTGIASQVGYANETTYGSRVAATRFLEHVDESLPFDVARVDSKALRAGNRSLRSDRWAAGRKTGAGRIRHEIANKGFGLLLEHCLGSLTWTQPDAGGNATVYEGTATLGTLVGKSLTVQIGRPDAGGTVNAFEYQGVKVTDWEIAGALDAFPMLTLNCDAAKLDTSQSLVSASYPSSQTLFDWTMETVLTIGGSQYDITDVAVRGTNALKTDRFAQGSNTKKEPVANAMSVISGEFGSEFVGMTALNRFLNGTTAAVVCKWLGATISTTYKYALEITLPCVRFDGDVPTVSGPDLLTQPLKWVALNDSSAGAPIQIVYRTTDTAK